MSTLRTLSLAGALGALLAADSRGDTIVLSALSSDQTPASVLDATLDFTLTGPSELTLTLTNDTADPDAYLINGVWFNAESHVSSLSLVSATHSAEGDVTAAWTPVELDTMVDGFGTFDFGLTDGVGTSNPNLIGPGESIAFVLSISGTGPFDASDFIVANANSLTAAAKFVSGPAENDPTETLEDSAFGAVPEPASAALLGAGLLGMAFAGCRRPGGHRAAARRAAR